MHMTSQAVGAAGRGAVLVAAVLLALSGCGSSSGAATGTDTGSSGPDPSSSTATAGVHVGSTSLGKVLVDGTGRTLYLLTADSPGRSSCDADCLTTWPPVAPASGNSIPGVTAKVSAATTPDGSAIATVGGWPLYTYIQDHGTGDVTGQGVESFGGVWYAVSPAGMPIKSEPGDDNSSDPGAGGYGNAY